MPGHTPEERAKNSADTSTQPGLDRDGGAAAVPNDSGFQARFQQWEQFLTRPEVRAGLLQFSAQILQPNPGGFGAALGQSVGEGLGAAGRVATLEREQGEATAALEVEAEQQERENVFEDRRVTEQERRGDILAARGAGGGAGPAVAGGDRAALWETFFIEENAAATSIGVEPIPLDPSTLDRLKRGALAAENDPDGDVMAAALAAGKFTAQEIALLYLDPVKRQRLKDALGVGGIPGGDGTGDPNAVATGATPETPRVAQITREPGETPEAFATRRQGREAAVVERETARDPEPRRLATNIANRQAQVRNRVQEELAAGRDSVEEIADRLILGGFTDEVSLKLLQAEFPELWDLVTEKLASGQ